MVLLMMFRFAPVALTLILLGVGCTDDPSGTRIIPNNDTRTNNATTNNSFPDMDTDMPLGALCSVNDDCEAPDVCVFDLTTGEGRCGSPAGPGNTGDLCTDGSDCRSGLCINGLCADPCQDSCPEGFDCESTSVPLVGGGDVSLNVCVPTPTACLADPNCANNTICVVERDNAATPLTCRGPAGPGDLGDACTSDDGCKSNLCLDGACSKPCERPNDCATDGSYLCSVTDVSTGGAANNIAVCQPRPEDSCLSDSQCTTGRCVATRTTTAVLFGCGTPNANGAEVGATCAVDGDCAQNLCVSGICAAPCQSTGDCAAAPDFACQLSPVTTTSGGTTNASICTPPTSCENNADCRVSEVCYIRPDAQGVDLFCRTKNVGGGNLGQVCTQATGCGNNYCLDTRFRDVCTQPCVSNADCPTAGYICGSVNVDYPGGTEPVSMCVPVAPTACSSNTQCPTGQRCSIIPNASNTALESVCVPTTGGLASGTACNTNDDCASLVCTNGFCSDPCTDSNQCGNAQVCRTAVVTKAPLSGNFQICETLATQQCSDTSSCSDGVRVCSDIRLNSTTSQYETFCELPGSGTGQLGDTCTADSQCRENICLPGSNTCSVVCNDDTDCGAGQGCTTYSYRTNNVTSHIGFCVDVCTDNQDCGGTNICTINSDFIADDVDLICEVPVGTGDLGTTCVTGNDCISGLCLTSYQYSATACTMDTDCAAGSTCLCPVDNPNCAAADKRCATSQLACTRICDGPEDCTGGNSTLTACSNDVVVQRPVSGATKRISTCSRPD